MQVAQMCPSIIGILKFHLLIWILSLKKKKKKKKHLKYYWDFFMHFTLMSLQKEFFSSHVPSD